MNSFLGSLGTVGVALALSALLLLGTQPGGRLKPLPWGACLVLSMVAGSAFKAAGPPFSFVSDLVGDGIGLTQGIMPGLTMPALALTMVIIILWKKLTLRGISIMGIAFWYVAAGAGGAWGILADRIHDIAQSAA
ncbi:hypothetical protein ABZ312_09765 [Streptomyces sp. NPDC006207]